ncbi:uncharacterized protein LOC128720842 [Anopheles nili]|uniref:uncharacterized protein LOC128720842 n=1 Tax=Anopheles nili TaxID=185578 RepID=UPI00237A70DE|nr:uncharacterized protein LOC128720842 [Anopheles nili]
MAATINPPTLDKLLHTLQEIRVRSLHDIENTLKRALWENVDLNINAASLFKNLIRWFGHAPICEEETVLELMSLLLESKYGTEIVKFYTPDRIIKELNKIRYLIGTNADHDLLVRSLIRQVDSFKSTPLRRASSSSSLDIESVVSSITSMKLDTMDPSGLPGCSRGTGIVDSFASRWKDDSGFFTSCWETPDFSVVAVLERFNSSLLDDTNDENFQRALNFVMPYIKDFPPEFLLQPPYVGLSLLHLIQKRRLSIRKGFGMLLSIIDSLRKRMRQRMLTVTYIPESGERTRTQVSIGAFVSEMFQIGIEQLKELSCDVDKLSTNMILIVLNQTTTFLMSEHFSEQQKIPAPRFAELCTELGYLVKHYRQEWETDTKRAVARTRYRITLQIMLDFVRLWQKDPDNSPPDPDVDRGISNEQFGATALYNASDFATLNSTAHRKALEEADDTWRHECQLALLDFPLKVACPEMYDNLCTYAGKENEPLLAWLITLKEKLFQAVLLLRDSASHSNLSDEHLLMLGSEAISTLIFHRSLDLVRVILKCVAKCAGSVTEDGPLWDTIESITVRLLAHADEEIRCQVYESCSNMMKDFIGQLDEAPILTRRSLFSQGSPKLRAMGMPLSLQILTEVTCYGYTSSNMKIRQCAETMLLFLCNSKAFLHEKWMDVRELLLPVAPLLQTVAVGQEQTKLRKAVLAMFHPDFGFPWLDVLQGNLRFLFHDESAIREEALTRVLFLISSVEQSEEFIPRIEHIGDTIPNGICLLSFPFNIERQQSTNVYEVSSVKPLLDVLEDEGGDPGMRRSALTQLNVMAEDPLLCELIHNESGWVLVLQALSNSLLANTHLDYPDAAIPAVGILTKLCFSITTFRRYLGGNSHAYQWLVRALLAHHHMPVFRMECCALLYLLLFAECSTGNGSNVFLPVMCERASYKVPFVSKFHWHTSPFRELSSFETMLQQMITGEHVSGPLGESILCINDKRMVNGDAVTTASVSCSGRAFVTELVHRYARFTFADLWFQGVDKVLKMYNSKQRTLAAGQFHDDDDAQIEYKGNRTAMGFCTQLRLRKRDVRWLKVIDFPSIFRKSIRRLSSAKAHADVFNGLGTLEANLIFPIKNTFCQQDIIISMLKRYIHTPPVTTADQEMLTEVLNIIGIMLHLDFLMVRQWLHEVLANETNLFLRLLRAEDCMEQLYAKNATLLWSLRHVMDREALDGDQKKGEPSKTGTKRDASESKKSNSVTMPWDVQVFSTAMNQLTVMVKKCDIPRIISLVEVIECYSVRIDVVCVNVVEVVPKLLLCIRNVGSSSFIGSAIVRFCLMAIMHLMERSAPEMARFEWTAKHLKTISTQCGNSSTMVRSYAWNILAKIARTLAGAAAIVKECSYLPGGVHASCISTILDIREACLVKESAVGLLVGLLSHRTDKIGPLHRSVVPLDKAAELRAVSSGTTSGRESLDVVMELLAKQRFFEQSVGSLKHYTCMEFVLDEDKGWTTIIVSADLVKAYAVLYRCLLDLDPAGFGQLLGEKGCIQGLLECVELQAVLPNRAVCLMVTEVCALLLRCMDEPNRQPVCDLLAGHQPFIESIVYVLNPWLYGKLAQPAMQQTLFSIMRLLCALLATSGGKLQIHLEFNHQDVKPIAQMIEQGISSKSSDFRMICYNFLSMMVHTSDTSTSPTAELPPFLAQLDTLDMFANEHEPSKSANIFLDEDDSEEEQDTENTNPNRPLSAAAEMYSKLVKAARTNDVSSTLRSGSALIFKALMEQYQLSCTRDQLESGHVQGNMHRRLLYRAMQNMLHFSAQACRMALMGNLLGIVFEWLNTIYECFPNSSHLPRINAESKKQGIVGELKEVSILLCAWFSVPGEALLLHKEQIDELCRILLQYWPFLCSHQALQIEFLQVLAFLTECHIIVCKAMAATFPNHPHSIMKLLIVTATTETAKVKGPRCDLQLLKLSLRVLRNCCCCHEGRSLIGKLNVFDNISKLHPSVTKLQKPWLEVTQVWLEFWEIYTRYIDVSEVRHLTVLGALVRKSDIDLRLLALGIIRNLTFVLANRPALLASSDYMFMLQNSLQRTSCGREILIAAVTMWKMIANNHRGKTAIKSSPLVRLIAGQVKLHSMTPGGNDQNELWNVLMTVYRILGA